MSQAAVERLQQMQEQHAQLARQLSGALKAPSCLVRSRCPFPSRGLKVKCCRSGGCEAWSTGACHPSPAVGGAAANCSGPRSTHCCQGEQQSSLSPTHHLRSWVRSALEYFVQSCVAQPCSDPLYDEQAELASLQRILADNESDDLLQSMASEESEELLQKVQPRLGIC